MLENSAPNTSSHEKFQLKAGARRFALLLGSTVQSFIRGCCQRQKDHRALQALPDYLLEDIGLDRAQVAEVDSMGTTSADIATGRPAVPFF